MTYTLSAARRRGQIGAHLPASRVICAPAAALPRCGDRLRAPARWAGGLVAARAPASGEYFPHHQHRFSGTVHGINKGKPFLPACGEGCPLMGKKGLREVSQRKRGRARRRSPPRRGGSSDAGRTLVPRGRGTAGVRTPAAARQRGGRRTADLFLRTVKDGCPNAGLGVVGGKGLRKPLPPAARRAGDHARMPGNIRHQRKTKKNPIHQCRQNPPSSAEKKAKSRTAPAYATSPRPIARNHQRKAAFPAPYQGEMCHLQRKNNARRRSPRRRPRLDAGHHPPASTRPEKEHHPPAPGSIHYPAAQKTRKRESGLPPYFILAGTVFFRSAVWGLDVFSLFGTIKQPEEDKK